MTLQEFNEHRFGIETIVRYKDCDYSISCIDFERGAITLRGSNFTHWIYYNEFEIIEP